MRPDDADMDVVDCAGGPWLNGTCGDLAANGPVGIRTAPQADLEVLGTVRFEALEVAADARVAVAGQVQPDDPALTVGGTLRADAFASDNTTIASVADDATVNNYPPYTVQPNDVLYMLLATVGANPGVFRGCQVTWVR